MCLHCVSSEQLHWEGLTSNNYSIKICSQRMAQVTSGAYTSESVAYMPYSMYVSVLVIEYPKTSNGSGVLP